MKLQFGDLLVEARGLDLALLLILFPFQHLLGGVHRGREAAHLAAEPVHFRFKRGGVEAHQDIVLGHQGTVFHQVDDLALVAPDGGRHHVGAGRIQDAHGLHLDIQVSLFHPHQLRFGG